MKFPKLFSKNKPEKDSYYIGLFLKESEGSIAFIHVESGSHTVLARRKFSYTNEWENIAEDIDEAIYKLENETQKSPDKTIFFIYSHLIDPATKDIKQPYLDKIKHIVKNLDLEPLGFIEYHEAVYEMLSKSEGAPITALLIEFDKTNLDIFAYRGGKLLYEENLTRTQHLIEDLVPSFEKMRAQFVIPSRIFLYDSSDLDVESSKLMTHKWPEDFFVQMPKVQVIHEQELFNALLKIFTDQIGGSSQSSNDIKQDFQEAHPQKEEHKKEVMGFVIGADAEPVPEHEISETAKQPSSLPIAALLMTKLQVLVTKVKNIFTGFKVPTSLKKGYLLPSIGVIIILLSVFLSELFFHKAQVTVFFPSKDINKEVVFDELTVDVATQSAEYEESKSTTGKKEVGEKARGQVTIYNSSISESKSFSKGTTISGPNNLKFTFDADIKVASASGDASSINSSTAKVAVSASEIGNEYNIASGTKFTIEGQSQGTVIAKNDSAFSGGSKRQVKTVAKQDIEELKNKVIDKAKSNLKNDIVQKLPKDMKLIPQLVEYSLSSPSYSKELGEEAETLSMESDVETSYATYREKEMRKLLVEEFKKENKEKGLTATEDKIKYAIIDATKEDDKYEIEVEAGVKLTPEVKKDNLIDRLTGKGSNTALNIVKNEFKAQGMELEVDSPLPFMKNTMPFFKRNINLKISYQ